MFADTVADEVAYGLKNLGYPKSEINVRVREALEQVGLDPEEVTGLSPLVLVVECAGGWLWLQYWLCSRKFWCWMSLQQD